MTVPATQPVDDANPPGDTPAPATLPGVVPGDDRTPFVVAMGLLLVMFLLLQNRYWVPGGDSEVYAGAARSILLGKGFSFGGVPVSMVPPGWSLVLAGAMKISPQFLFLKLITMTCMLGSLAIMYWICRRFASPKLCAIVIVLSGIISHVYSLTFWLHSDSLFCLLSSAALLLAFQISEGRRSILRMSLLVLFCMLAIAVRWAGLLSFMLVGAVLLHGELWPRINYRWVLVVLCGLFSVGTFLGIRRALRVEPGMQRSDIVAPESGEEGTSALNPRLDATLATQYYYINPARGGWGYLARAAGWGTWFSYLVWQPSRIGRFLVVPSLVCGWMILLPLLLLGWQSFRSRQWIWLALLIYSFALAMNWPHPVARYLVPITPLILLGVFIGYPRLFAENWLLPCALWFGFALVLGWNVPGRWWIVATRVLLVIGAVLALFLLANHYRRRMRDESIALIRRSLLACFVGSLILCNGALWAVDVYVARSADFYGMYEAGLNRELINAAEWLNQNTPGENAIAVSRRYVNMGRVKIDSVQGMRVAAFLTDRPIISLPDRYIKPRPATTNPDGTLARGAYSGDPRRNKDFVEWARGLNVKYVLYQPAVSPWRVFHFRMGWLQTYMTGSPPEDTRAGWRLYAIPPEGTEAKSIPLTSTDQWPTRVPGL